MRREIDAVVHMTLGLISTYDQTLWVCRDTTQKDLSLRSFSVFESVDCEWRLQSSQTLIVICDLVATSSAGVKRTPQAYTSFHGGSDIRSKDVQRVHQVLPVFIQGMVKEFPSLERDWQFILDAATVE